MKLTEVNIDCLTTVLDHLDFFDLVNAAASNKHLKYAAQMVYGRKYGRKVISFQTHSQSYVHTSHAQFNEHTSKKIGIEDLRTTLLLLRCFGHLMKEIEYYPVNDKSQPHITGYINKFCAETLIRISLLQIERFSNLNLLRPFSQVRKVTINLRGESLDIVFINKTFPTVQELMLKWDTESGRGMTLNQLPHLEHLDVNFHQNLGKFLKKLIKTLAISQNLKHLKLQTPFPYDFLEAIGSSLRNLESLEIIAEFGLYEAIVRRSTSSETIHLPKLKQLNINFRFLLHEGEKLPFSIDKLESFYIQNALGDAMEVINDFLEKNPSIKMMKLKNGCEREAYITRLYWDLSHLERVKRHSYACQKQVMANFGFCLLSLFVAFGLRYLNE